MLPSHDFGKRPSLCLVPARGAGGRVRGVLRLTLEEMWRGLRPLHISHGWGSGGGLRPPPDPHPNCKVRKNHVLAIDHTDLGGPRPRYINSGATNHTAVGAKRTHGRCET